MNPVATIRAVLSLALDLYFLVLIARLIIDWALAVNRAWTPSGTSARMIGLIYRVTDPPLRFLRRFLPPVRMGPISFDIAFLALFIAVGILQRLI